MTFNFILINIYRRSLAHSSEAAHVTELFRTLYCICQIYSISMMTWSVLAVLYVVQHVPDFIVWTEVIVHQLYDN